MERRARWIAVATVFAAATLCATGVAHAQTETYVALFGDARSIVGPQSLLFTSADSSIV